ncbi:phosphoribosylpyrophosphate synthetase [Muricauda oceani]|uniref:Phosphoribosylpyrophosphate synthetase n=1 Tax=Flagellimonas oceani TaxID=2698672 RepID=A0A6G7IZY2_9FLAO|nr:phosphoribosylpyrophosphate synthetase [Allomuricauda oceani]MBW8243676.1 phosphoribosylpyrophosphate synthetase [Allomuricauda oceani]QII43960.1 phosphoribosylpyrophosphate synthetase [Allomuricauda oceani]
MNRDFDTLSQAMNVLRDEGYVEDFNLKQNCLECRNGEYKVFHDEFKVDEYYRFEGMSDPGDSSVLYAISSDKYKLKGQLVNGYGIYSESITDEMLNKLKV